MNKLFSIFLLFAVALSSVGMSVSQHFCTMSKAEIEASMCDMCSSEDHEAPQKDENSCCSNEEVHLRVDTEATSAKPQVTPYPIISEPLIALVLESSSSIAQLPALVKLEGHPAFPLSQEHTVLKV